MRNSDTLKVFNYGYNTCIFPLAGLGWGISMCKMIFEPTRMGQNHQETQWYEHLQNKRICFEDARVLLGEIAPYSIAKNCYANIITSQTYSRLMFKLSLLARSIQCWHLSPVRALCQTDAWLHNWNLWDRLRAQSCTDRSFIFLMGRCMWSKSV